MSYVIAEDCIDVNDRACADECPVDCIYVGGRKSYIHPGECIDCGACVEVCPVEAIVADRQADPDQRSFLEDATAFFTGVLPGREAPLGSPRGARHVGVVGVDTPRVAAWPEAG